MNVNIIRDDSEEKVISLRAGRTKSSENNVTDRRVRMAFLTHNIRERSSIPLSSQKVESIS